MGWLGESVRGLRCWWQRDQLDRDLADEMQLHLDLRRAEKERAGMAPDSARTSARREFGNTTSLREESRALWGWPLIETLWKDLRYSARLLWKDRLCSTTIIVTLTLCIGMNVTSFSVLYGLILNPLPFEHAERLVEVTTPISGGGPQTSSWSWTQYRDYQENADLFDGFAAMSPSTIVIDQGSEATRVSGQLLTAGFFDLMGVEPLIGRFFTEEENVEGAHRVIVMPQSVWQADYLSDPDVIGREIRVVGEPAYTIVGVAPGRLQVFDPTAKFFAPFRVQSRDVNPQARYGRGGRLWARLKPGAGRAAAAAQLRSIERRWFDETATSQSRASYSGRIGQTGFGRPEPLRKPLFLLQGCALLALLAGLVNVVNLTSGRVMRIGHELSLRHALGAGRFALYRLMLLHSALMSGLAAGASVILAWGGLSLINRFLAAAEPQAAPVEPSTLVLGSTLAIAFGITLATGLLPVALLWKTGWIQKIGGGVQSMTQSRASRVFSNGLVMGQVSIVFVLLVGAGLLLRSLSNVMAVDPGFDASHVVQGRIELRGLYEYADTIALINRVLAAMKEIPGVEHVSLMPYESFKTYNPENTRDVVIRGDSGGAHQMVRHLVTPEYFATMGIPIREGRDFRPTDDKNVYVVDELFAERYLRRAGALGAEIHADKSPPSAPQPWSRVIGVVARANLRGLEQRDGLPVAYTFLNDQSGNWAYTVLVRTTRPPGEVLQEMSRRVHDIDPRLPLFNQGTLQKSLDSMLLRRRGITFLATAFGLLALLLSAAGLYGVLAYDVQRRRREIGIRYAIGATRWQTLAMILRQGLGKTLVGIIVGLVLSPFAGRYLESQLFDMAALDSWTYASTTGLVFVVALIASLVPARRALGINPVESLQAN